MDIFPDWLGPRGTGTGETVYVEVPVSGLQGGRILKDIIVTAKIKLKRRRKKINIFAKFKR